MMALRKSVLNIFEQAEMLIIDMRFWVQVRFRLQSQMSYITTYSQDIKL